MTTIIKRSARPYLSIVIPYYNAPENLERLLGSIRKSKDAPPYELIIVDDGSEAAVTLTAGSAGRVSRDSLQFRREMKATSPSPPSSLRSEGSQDLRIVRLPHNKGPAVARNRGVAAARGKFVVFLDCDVEVYPDTLKQIAKVFNDDPDVVALTGVWVKHQRSKAFFPNFKALRDWSYWINERDKSGYYFLFSTRIAVIKRSVFVRLGGFDETYPAPLVEDIELTYRIARRYAIIFAPEVRVRHEFEGFWPIAKKYFLRAYYWTKLYQRRKKFDPVATTWQEAITTVSGVGIVVMGLMSLIGPIRQICFMGLLGASVVHVFLVRKFLGFLYREKGLVFAVKSFFMGLVLYCFIFAGAGWGKIAGKQEREQGVRARRFPEE